MARKVDKARNTRLCDTERLLQALGLTVLQVFAETLVDQESSSLHCYSPGHWIRMAESCSLECDAFLRPSLAVQLGIIAAIWTK